MAYYQSTANVTRQIEHPHYETSNGFKFTQDFQWNYWITTSGDISIAVDALQRI